MERRGWGLGCVIAWLGLILGCCLLPYLVSSVYSIVTAVLQVPSGAEWLWGDWLSTVVEVDSPAYMVLAEGPICCVGTIALLIIVLGLVLTIGGIGPSGPSYEQELPETEENLGG